jgi:ubiquinone/menaquinone biosynthesis C-methylase UbiE
VTRAEAPDVGRALGQYRRRAQGYDRRTRRADPYRRSAVERLLLHGGETVLDIACGTGVNFPLLEKFVGPRGRIVGVDVSPEMLGQAEERARRAGWRNVTLIEDHAERAELPAEADAALFSLTHDVLQSPAAVENVVRALRPRGRVASFGAKWAPRWRVPVNAYVWFIARKYVTTFAGFDRPWRQLERFVPGLQVEEGGFGGIYVAWGEIEPSPTGGSPRLADRS